MMPVIEGGDFIRCDVKLRDVHCNYSAAGSSKQVYEPSAKQQKFLAEFSGGRGRMGCGFRCFFSSGGLLRLFERFADLCSPHLVSTVTVEVTKLWPSAEIANS